MSRAFVKEDDIGISTIPDRPTSRHPNYIRPSGLNTLQARLASLEERRRRLEDGDGLADEETKRTIERDIHYLKDRLARAIVIDLARQPKDSVAFGACVRTADHDGTERRFWIVGEDEADAAAGRLSWVSPLARALEGATVGESIEWSRPAGNITLKILTIDYRDEP